MRCFEAAVPAGTRDLVNSLPAAIRIVVPALNAADTLPDLLSRLTRWTPAEAILVVDDGSTDTTQAIAAESGTMVCRHDVNRGKGAALKSGIRAAFKDPRCSAVVTMDADGQHDPEDLGAFIASWERDGADLVLGNRQILGSRMPLHRRLSNLTTSFLVSSRMGRIIPDSQCGYRLLSRRAGETIIPSSDGFEAETEWLLRAAAKRMVITSVPVRTVYRGERSHMQNWKTTKAFIRVLVREYSWAD